MNPLHWLRRTGGRRRPLWAIIATLFFVSLFLLAVAELGSSWTSNPFPNNYRITSPARWRNRVSKTRAPPTGDKYLVGAGRADITGPVVEINFAGYADLSQRGTGLRQRLYSRAFIVGDPASPADRFAYLVLDTQSGDSALRQGILEGVAALGKEYEVYGRSNIAVTGTHSHSGPGAWFNYLLPQITSLGFDKQSYQAIVDGAVLSVKRAHESLTTGFLDYSTVNITDGNLSRSLSAYLANPDTERARYDSSTDTEMSVLRLRRETDLKTVGLLTWYPVHGTSMLQNNTHVSGDNKGLAAYLLEESMRTDPTAADGFVGGFSQANVGDTTPNVLGAFCDDGSGQMCSFENSTCGDGKSQSCHGRGPEFQKLDLGVSSCYEIGRRQSSGAIAAYNAMSTSSTPVVGSVVRSFHFYHDMRFWRFQLPDGREAQTCPAALGYSFAAGTSDGPGAFDFTQGDSGEPSANPLWRVVSGLLRTPSPEQKACQQPKPILLDVGEMDVPYAWTPNIVDIQVLRVGQLFVIVAPVEASTMAGRRWREAVAAEAGALADHDETGAAPKVVLGGPANTYAHYTVTPEEYAVQRYEGASTLFGQWTLPALINLTLSNMKYLSMASPSSDSPPSGPSPPDNRKNSLSFITGVVQDSAPIGSAFGRCTTQPRGTYTRGDVASAVFVGANPRNKLRLEGTFAAVEKKENEEWKQVRSDRDWSLVYTWQRTNFLLGHSTATLSWETEKEAEAGTYRFRYYGDAKPLIGAVTAFEGTSEAFVLS